MQASRTSGIYTGMDEMVGMGRGLSIWEVRMDEVVEVEDGRGGGGRGWGRRWWCLTGGWG